MCVQMQVIESMRAEYARNEAIEFGKDLGLPEVGGFNPSPLKVCEETQQRIRLVLKIFCLS